MKPPADDLERRRPVWEAMSWFFLDTEISDGVREGIIRTLESSGYSESELDHILWAEICPVLYSNKCCVAGEWAGFDMEQVEKKIIANPAGEFRQDWAYFRAGHMVDHKWREMKASIAARRNNPRPL